MSVASASAASNFNSRAAVACTGRPPVVQLCGGWQWDRRVREVQ